MSVTMDGYIARPDGNSEWVSQIDCELFEKRYKEIGCVVVGRKTFNQFQGDLYPIEGVTNIVLTREPEVSSDLDNVYFVNSINEAVELAEKKEHKRILIAGGGHTNGSFLSENMIDEVFLSVHPFNLNEGIKLFEGATKEHAFKLIDTREMGGGLVELHYEK